VDCDFPNGKIFKGRGGVELLAELQKLLVCDENLPSDWGADPAFATTQLFAENTKIVSASCNCRSSDERRGAQFPNFENLSGSLIEEDFIMRMLKNMSTGCCQPSAHQACYKIQFANGARDVDLNSGTCG